MISPLYQALAPLTLPTRALGTDPRSDPSLLLWFDSSQGLFSDDAGTTPATAGQKVAVWTPRAWDATRFANALAASAKQTDDARRPLVDVTSPYPQRVDTRRFSGQTFGPWMACDLSSLAGTPFTVIYVAYAFTVMSGSGAVVGVQGASGTSSPLGTEWAFGSYNFNQFWVGANRRDYGGPAVNVNGAYRRLSTVNGQSRYDAHFASFVVANVASTGVSVGHTVTTHTRYGATAVHSDAATSGTSNQASPASPVLFSSLPNGRIGYGNQTTNNTWDGWIGHILAFRAAKTTDEIAAFRTFLEPRS